MSRLALSAVAFAAFCTGAAIVHAQQSSLYSPVDTTTVQQAATAAVQAVGPQPCAVVPLPDTLMGSSGSATPCTPRADATRPTVVQAANTMTDGTGSWSVTWARSFQASAPVIVPVPAGVSALPMTCAVFARTASAASGRCWQAVTTTLGSTLTSIAGAVISPFSLVAANTPVMVVGREPTQ